MFAGVDHDHDFRHEVARFGTLHRRAALSPEQEQLPAVAFDLRCQPTNTVLVVDQVDLLLLVPLADEFS